LFNYAAFERDGGGVALSFVADTPQQKLGSVLNLKKERPNLKYCGPGFIVHCWLSC
jgi:hypothetical protein